VRTISGSERLGGLPTSGCHGGRAPRLGHECLAVGLAMTLVLGPCVEALAVPSRPGATLHRPTLPQSPGGSLTTQVEASGLEQADASAARLKEAVKTLPLYFIENRGQADPRVAYYVQGADTSVYFTRAGITFALSGPSKSGASAAAPSGEAGLPPPAAARERWAVKLDFVGANAQAAPTAEDRTEAHVSYFKGKEAEWKTGLPTYSRVVYRQLWPGIR